MTDDIVAELDRWIKSGFDGSLIRDLMQRACDEIVALREQLEITSRHLEGAYNHRLTEVRADARERTIQWAQENMVEAIDLAARAMAKGAGQRMFDDFDDPNAEDDREWWRARAGDAYRAYTSAIEAYAARKVAEERERCAQIADNGATLVENWDIKFTSPARMAADLARDIADAIRKEPS
jgi:hypothetical protein